LQFPIPHAKLTDIPPPKKRPPAIWPSWSSLSGWSSGRTGVAGSVMEPLEGAVVPKETRRRQSDALLAILSTSITTLLADTTITLSVASRSSRLRRLAF
jgi:hypothetical protein